MCPIQKCDTATSFPLSREGNLNSVWAQPWEVGKLLGPEGVFPHLSLSASPHSWKNAVVMLITSCDANMSRNQIPTGKPWRRGRTRSPAHGKREAKGRVVWSKEFGLDFLWNRIPPHSMPTFSSLLCFLPASHHSLFSKPYFVSPAIFLFPLYLCLLSLPVAPWKRISHDSGPWPWDDVM